MTTVTAPSPILSRPGGCIARRPPAAALAIIWLRRSCGGPGASVRRGFVSRARAALLVPQGSGSGAHECAAPRPHVLNDAGARSRVQPVPVANARNIHRLRQGWGSAAGGQSLRRAWSCRRLSGARQVEVPVQEHRLRQWAGAGLGLPVPQGQRARLRASPLCRGRARLDAAGEHSNVAD